MTNQEIFDRVAQHLLRQNSRSVLVGKNDACRYRGSAGLKCAIGCLIADEDYEPEMEGRSPTETGGDLVSRWAQRMGFDIKFLRCLQAIHDTKLIGAWPNELRQLAAGKNLSADVVDKTMEEIRNDPARSV